VRPIVTTSSCGLLLGLALCLGVLASGTTPTAAPNTSKVKAVFLFHFVKFVEWPKGADAQDHLTYCILGQDPFGTELDALVESKAPAGRAIAVRRLTPLEEMRNCHVLFISASEEKDLKAILARQARAPLLTVSDIDLFVERGGMIGFTFEANKVRFDINVAAAARASLKISSRLLRLSRRVIGAPEGGG
jgi:hypothetical protein